jgi:hypothetical protein
MLGRRGCGNRKRERKGHASEAEEETMTETLIAALRYWQLGWSIIPMEGKRPRTRQRWKPYQTKRATEETVCKWFGNGSAYGIGVVFGDVSGGLASADFDCMAGYGRWAEAYPDLARTLPTVETRRGRHVYSK